MDGWMDLIGLTFFHLLHGNHETGIHGLKEEIWRSFILFLNRVSCVNQCHQRSNAFQKKKSFYIQKYINWSRYCVLESMTLLQPRIVYPVKFSFKFDGVIKSFTEKQKLRVQHHQTSLKTNVKGVSLGEKRKGHKKEETYKVKK